MNTGKIAISCTLPEKCTKYLKARAARERRSVSNLLDVIVSAAMDDEECIKRISNTV